MTPISRCVMITGGTGVASRASAPLACGYRATLASVAGNSIGSGALSLPDDRAEAAHTYCERGLTTRTLIDTVPIEPIQPLSQEDTGLARCLNHPHTPGQPHGRARTIGETATT